MAHRNGNFALLALFISALALSAMVYTDAYSHAAQAEASGYSALTHEVGGGAVLCLNDVATQLAPVVAQ